MNSSVSRGKFLFYTLVMAIALGFTARGSDDGKSGVAAGQKAPTFKATTLTKKPVSFPEDYKGKVVLLDFWATWCPPCRAEIPNVVAAYTKYHEKGFEVLGVSLDGPEEALKLVPFLKQNKMVWPEIYDAKEWKADVAVQYGIRSIPRPILVDGTTGVIIAEGPAARGSRLETAIEKALAKTPAK